jgi:hypothetical protein
LIRRASGLVAPKDYPGLSRPSIIGKPPAMILTPASPEFGAVSQFVAQRSQNANPFPSGTWASANDPIALPFFLYEPLTVYQLGWHNGSGTMTDSCDVGVYDSSWVRKISTTGTARTGVSALQFVDVSDTTIGPGKFYLAMSNNGTTANQQQFFAGPANAVICGLLGMLDSATDAYVLPDPLTGMAAAATFTQIPALVIAARTVV